MNNTTIYIELIDDSNMPFYANFNDVGADLYLTEDLVIRPGETLVTKLNFKVAMEDNIEIQIRPRSGLSLKTSLKVSNSPGTIDPGYRDNIGLILENNYNISNLNYEIYNDPSIMDKLLENYKIVHLKDHLNSKSSLLDGLNPIIIDKKGNPYGTIYLEKGNKIAQMIVAEFKKAKFIKTNNVSDIGTNRNGGFGSTGI